MRRTFALLLLLVPDPAAAADPVDFRREIRPMLQERCFACHGALKQNAKLRVDSAAAMLKAGVVVPGKPEASELLARVSSADDEVRMPPEGHPLKPAEVAKLRAWIAEGAKVPADDAPEPDPRDHWSFRPPVRPAPPAGGHPVDAFIAAEWRNRGLEPQPLADKRVLLRRVSLDLTGLPPTRDEYEAFVKDSAPDAYEKVVDRLLASPQYGERWGRHFLDVWRYSDWWGLGAELRNSQKHIWHWRDWTVESFNADMGYDEMLRLMLAADEFAPADWNRLRATGYLARSYFLFNRTSWLDEVVEHSGKGFLGLTFNCTKCHDHKYDPISQQNYYQFRAVFEPYQVRLDMVPGELDFEKNGIPRAFDCNLTAKTPFHIRGDERNPDPNRTVEPGLPTFLAPNGLAIEPVKLPRVAVQPGTRPEIIATYRAQAEAKLKTAKDTAARLDAGFAMRPQWQRDAMLYAATKPIAAAEQELAAVRAAEANPEQSTLRGALKSKESNVEPDASRNRPFPDTSTGRRKAFALWLTDRSHPLAARVAVNHIWLRHFGQPLVPTVFDFGRKGTPPTHPELLDWLAVELMENRWSMKRIHRLIVTSRVYRLSTTTLNAAENVKRDSENRYLWRMNGQRMQAQTVRDSLLHLAGDLDLAMGGPPVPLAAQDASRRRSMYFFHSHNEHNKLLGLFDDANVLECYRRTESIVPQQALALTNSRFAQTATAKIAAQLNARAGADDSAFIDAAFELILGNVPTAPERQACLDAIAELRTALANLKEPDRTHRARHGVVAALINHNDFVTVR